MQHEIVIENDGRMCRWKKLKRVKFDGPGGWARSESWPVVVAEKGLISGSKAHYPDGMEWSTADPKIIRLLPQTLWIGIKVPNYGKSSSRRGRKSSSSIDRSDVIQPLGFQLPDRDF